MYLMIKNHKDRFSFDEAHLNGLVQIYRWSHSCSRSPSTDTNTFVCECFISQIKDSVSVLTAPYLTN